MLTWASFSGVSWTWSGDLDHIHTIQSWDDESGSAKVPTKIQYDNNKPSAWGYTTEDSATTFGWFKLVLDYESLPPGIKSSPHVQDIHEKLRAWPLCRNNPAKAAMKATTDYLRLLWRHAIEVILKQRGHTWAHGMPCKVVITRPAIWSQKATSRTRKAAEKAIVANCEPFESVTLSLVSEPEAAAHAVLQAPDIALRPDLTQVGSFIWQSYDNALSNLTIV